MDSKDEIQNYIDVWNNMVVFEESLRESGERLRESRPLLIPKKSEEAAEEAAEQAGFNHHLKHQIFLSLTHQEALPQKAFS